MVTLTRGRDRERKRLWGRGGWGGRETERVRATAGKRKEDERDLPETPTREIGRERTRRDDGIGRG